MTECQGCGAWNERSRERCVLCGTPLAATDEWDATAELPPLPPLPDGGLRDSMPSWLREPPDKVGSRESEVGGKTVVARPLTTAQAPATSDARLPTPGFGPHADPRTFLSDDDFPLWLRQLAAREASTPALAALPPAAARNWPEWPRTSPESAAIPSQDESQPAASVAAPAMAERRPRATWETLLLVILVLGVVAAALWALVANGVFGPRL